MARWAFPLLAALCACGGGEPAGVGHETRDSLGIEIVENASPELAGSAAWTIDPEPVLEIGSVDGEEPYVFTRIWDASRFPDGRIAVVDEIALDVRIFDADGRHLTTFGGAGDGPREFLGVPFVEVAGEDVLTVWDGGHRRLSRFAPDGELLEQTNMEPSLTELGVMGFRNGLVWEIDADGTLLSTGPVRPQNVEGARDSFRRITVFEDGGSVGHDLGTFVSGRSFVVRLDRMSIGVGNPYAPFTPAGLAPGGRVAIGDTTRWEVRIVEPEGDLVRIVRAAIPRVPVTDELREAGAERARQMAETSPMTLAQAEDAYSQLELPDSVPAVGSITASGDLLWVGRRSGEWFSAPTEYDVFGGDGRWLTTVAMPPGIDQVLEIGDNHVLVRIVDDLDVPFLRMYRIVRGG